jgi:hypothetical protein
MPVAYSSLFDPRSVKEAFYKISTSFFSEMTAETLKNGELKSKGVVARRIRRCEKNQTLRQ